MRLPRLFLFVQCWNARQMFQCKMYIFTSKQEQELLKIQLIEAGENVPQPKVKPVQYHHEQRRSFTPKPKLRNTLGIENALRNTFVFGEHVLGLGETKYVLSFWP